MVKAAIQNWSLSCDVWPSFSRFAVRLKNDYKQNWHPKHWTRSKTDRCTSSMSQNKKIQCLRIGELDFGMWRYVECTCTMNPGRRWRCSVYLSNTWNQSPHKEVWHWRGLKSLIIMIWKPQKPKIHYLLYTTWQSKSLHYKTFNNTTDLTFYSNKIISLHIEAQNIIARISKIWPSGEYRQTHDHRMHFSLPTVQTFISKSHWHRWWL
jgi:hypothetical protein